MEHQRTYCDHCKHPIMNYPDSVGTGYAVDRNTDQTICYACCAYQDEIQMITKGNITLYLSKTADDKWKVSNWCDTLKLNPIMKIVKSDHRCFGGRQSRYDFWFVGPDMHIWHGIQRGNNNQLARCKRTKLTWIEVSPGSWGIKRNR